MEGVIRMSMRGVEGWVRLLGIAVLMAVVLFPAGLVALMTVEMLTWRLWDRSTGPPVWLDVVNVTVIVLLLAFPGAVVGIAAGLRRWWLLLPMTLSALAGVGAHALGLLVAGEEPWLWVPAAGTVAGSLIAVAIADRLGGSDRVAGDAHAGRLGGGDRVPLPATSERPVRSRESRVIGGVCGGWARSHALQPGLVRVAVVVLVVGIPPLVVVILVFYVYAYLTWPLEAAPTPPDPSAMV